MYPNATCKRIDTVKVPTKVDSSMQVWLLSSMSGVLRNSGAAIHQRKVLELNDHHS